MKKSKLIFLFLFCTKTFLLSNPIDNTPLTRFSELVFDSNSNWIMELSFPFGYEPSSTDSIIIKVSNIEARLRFAYEDRTFIAVVTSDSLSIPLFINRGGDKIVIYTYSTQPYDSTIKLVRKDSIIFGNYPGATVGQPVSGYSLIRNFWRYSYNYITIDCITKNPSLGVANDTVGLSGTLKGYIYDIDGKLVTKLKVFPVSPCYFVLETPLTIDSNGTYTTKIFPTLCSPARLMVRLVDFEGWIDSVEIEPFELKDIYPDTVVVQDIHLKDNRYIVTSVKNEISTISDELTLINYPNPFNLSTNFFVKIPARMKGKPGSITIFNIDGELIRNIPINEDVTAYWNGRDTDGRIMPSGIYYYRLNIDKQVMKTGSMILLK